MKETQESKKEGTVKGTPSMLKPLIVAFARDHGFFASSGWDPSEDTREFKRLFIEYVDNQNKFHQTGTIELQLLPERRTLITFRNTVRHGKIPPPKDQQKFNDFREKLIIRLAQLGFVELRPPPKKPLGFIKEK